MVLKTNLLIAALIVLVSFNASGNWNKLVQEDNVPYNPSHIMGGPRQEAYPIMCGPLGITVTVKANSSTCTVFKIESRSFPKYITCDKLEVGDTIVSINGKAISVMETTNAGTQCTGPLVDLGNALSTKQIEMTVTSAKDKTKKVIIDNSQFIPFTDITSSRCVSRTMIRDINTTMKKFKSPVATYGDGGGVLVSSSLIHLFKLNNGSTIDTRKFLYAMYDEYNKDKAYLASSWKINYVCTVALEYLNQKKSKKIERFTQLLLDDLAQRTSDGGRHGHFYDVGYEGRGINAITAHVYLNMLLGEKLKFKIDQTKKTAIVKWLDECSMYDHLGYIYSPNGSPSEPAYRDGLYAVALRIANRQSEFESLSVKIVNDAKKGMNGHALSNIALFWHSMCLNSDIEKKKQYLSNWNWYFNITTPRSKSGLTRLYLTMSCQDAYMNHSVVSHGVHGLIFSSSNKKLMILK